MLCASTIKPSFVTRDASAEPLEIMVRWMVMIQTWAQTFNPQSHEIHFTRVACASRGAGFMEQLPKSRGMQIAGDTPNERKELGYGFKRHVFFRESSVRFPGHQHSDELRIRKNASRERHLHRSLQSLENSRLWRLRHNRLQPIEAPAATVHVWNVLCREMK